MSNLDQAIHGDDHVHLAAPLPQFKRWMFEDTDTHQPIRIFERGLQ